MTRRVGPAVSDGARSLGPCPHLWLDITAGNDTSVRVPHAGSTRSKAAPICTRHARLPRLSRKGEHGGEKPRADAVERTASCRWCPLRLPPPLFTIRRLDAFSICFHARGARSHVVASAVTAITSLARNLKITAEVLGTLGQELRPRASGSPEEASRPYLHMTTPTVVRAAKFLAIRCRIPLALASMGLICGRLHIIS